MLPERLGRYQILGELATGGMAEILLARISGPGRFERPVILKRILPHLARQESFVTMFLDEARLVAQIRHQNVVNVHELCHERDELFMVLEYLEGESIAALLKRLVSRGEFLEYVLVCLVVAEACAGLHAAHELTDSKGNALHLVHRDVSPQNLFVTYDGQVKVLDFGIAKSGDRVTRTETGQLKGKLEYMSPEQCRNATLDRRSDIFALGVVLYELSTLRRLFKRRSPVEVLKAISSGTIVPPSRLVETVPANLEAICMRALALRPADRYPNALEMRRDLLAFVRAEDTAGDPTSRLAALMRELFADRIVEKRELLQRLESGSGVIKVPRGDFEDPVELPDAVDGESATGIRSTVSANAERTSGRSRAASFMLLASALSVGAVAGGAGIRWYSRSTSQAPPTPTAEPAVAPEATTPPPLTSLSSAPAPIASLSSAPAPEVFDGGAGRNRARRMTSSHAATSAKAPESNPWTKFH